MATQNQNNGSDSNQTMIVVFALLLILMALGYFSLPYLKTAWLPYAKVEGYLTYYSTLDEAVRFQASKLIEWTNEVSPSQVEYTMFHDVRAKIIARGWHNYILFLLLIVLGFFAGRRWSLYKGLPNLDTLLETEHRVWPTLIFIKNFNPIQKWKELRGHGRYLVTPFTFSVENEILTNYKARKKADRIFHTERAEKVFGDSLGEKFTSYQSLPGLQQLLILHCLAAETKSHFQDVIRIAATQLSKTNMSLDEMNTYWSDYLSSSVMAILDGEKGTKSSNSVIANVVNSVLKQHNEIKKEKESNPYSRRISIIDFFGMAPNKHAYNYTLLISAMRHVKRGGKFTSGRLVYFKAFDRLLFLVINLTPYHVERDGHKFVSGFAAEVLGIFSHYQHEEFAKRALTDAYVGTAVTSLQARLETQNLIGADESADKT